MIADSRPIPGLYVAIGQVFGNLMAGIRDGAVIEVATENDASALVFADVARHGIGLNSALLGGGGQFLDDERARFK